ncbi:hypothetical protein ABPG77_001522 [Micractinium sp. CCAP 211/92]
MNRGQPSTLRGTARVQAEFKRFRRAVERGELLGVTSVDLLGDRLDLWRIHVSAFDADVAAGAQLNRDLAALEAAHGPDAAHVVLEARFPPDYPAEPFFLRVVRPRMALYSGHVTAGGSICIQALTTGPEAGCWRPTLSVESVLALVLFNMLNAEAVDVRTAVAGGRAGPLRIAMGPNVLQEYSEAEAKQAFARMVATHRQSGWAGQATLAPGAARPGIAAPTAGRAAAGASRAAASKPQPQLPHAAGRLGSSIEGLGGSSRPTPALGRAASQPAGARAAVLGTHQKAAGAAAPLATASGAAAAAAAGALPPRKRPAPAPAQVIDLLSDSEEENHDGGKVNRPPGAAGGTKRHAPGQGSLLTVSGRSVASGSANLGVPGGGAAAAAAAARPAERSGVGSSRLGGASAMAADIDLTGDDSRAAAAQQAQQRPRSLPGRGRGGKGGSGDGGEPAEPAEPAVPAEPAESAVPAAPSLAERLEAANQRHGLDLRLPPAHWLVTDALLDGKLVLVELPLPGQQPTGDDQVDEDKVAALLDNGVTRAQAVEALAASGGSVSKAELWLIEKQLGGGAAGAAGGADPLAMRELRANGLSEQDAVAALEACGGKVDEALLYYIETMPKGGPAAVRPRPGAAPAAARRSRAQQERERREAARRAELEAQRKRQLAEAEEVLAAFERGGVARSRVQRIERVQQLDLWSQYQRRLARIAKEVGRGQENERRLFHGADQKTLKIICTDGFDHRVANLHGSLGGGTYFAEQSSYSEGYSQMKEHSAAAQAGTIHAFPGAIAVPPILGGTTWGTWPAAATSRAKRRGAQAGRQPAAAPPPAPSAGHPGRRSRDAAPRFLKDGLAMLLCSVALGRQCRGNPSLRRPEPGTHSATGGVYHAVYDNDQAYPTHLIHFK